MDSAQVGLTVFMIGGIAGLLLLTTVEHCGLGGLNKRCYGNDTCDAKLACIRQSSGALKCLDADPKPATKE